MRYIQINGIDYIERLQPGDRVHWREERYRARQSTRPWCSGTVVKVGVAGPQHDSVVDVRPDGEPDRTVFGPAYIFFLGEAP